MTGVRAQATDVQFVAQMHNLLSDLSPAPAHHLG
jgi:hypothetical protein